MSDSQTVYSYIQSKCNSYISLERCEHTYSQYSLDRKIKYDVWISSPGTEDILANKEYATTYYFLKVVGDIFDGYEFIIKCKSQNLKPPVIDKSIKNNIDIFFKAINNINMINSNLYYIEFMNGTNECNANTENDNEICLDIYFEYFENKTDSNGKKICKRQFAIFIKVANEITFDCDCDYVTNKICKAEDLPIILKGLLKNEKYLLEFDGDVHEKEILEYINEMEKSV